MSIKTSIPPPRIANVLAFAILSVMTPTSDASICYGQVGNGRLEDGVQLPPRGKNFSAYSDIGVSLGRTYVHQAVRDAVIETYNELLLRAPEKQFIYGETGHSRGGPFPPHRTHQNGLSVDFMVPVVDSSGRPARLPIGANNKFGYDLEFDKKGTLGDLHIDFDAMAEQLYQLALITKKRKIAMARVIFDPQLAALLFRTKRGADLQNSLPFMKTKPWVRHDEHYHVDFLLPCRPLSEYREGDKLPASQATN